MHYLGRLRDVPEAAEQKELYKTPADVDPNFDEPKVFDPAGFAWCLHCERAFPTGDIRVTGSRERGTYTLECPIEDCDAGLMDLHPWHPDHWPKNANPEYPDVPEAYGDYPLYPT